MKKTITILTLLCLLCALLPGFCAFAEESDAARRGEAAIKAT